MTNLAALLSPQSVAVIGASADTTILRGRTLSVMLGHAYVGRLYPVSRSQSEIQGLRAYASIDAVPERVDLALLIIPAAHVPDELERCGRAGVKAALIITSGFAEQNGKNGEGGEEGAAMQQRLRDIATRYDMIVCGPNTEGFVNTAVNLCATFSPVVDALPMTLVPVPLVPPSRTKGQVAVVAQSGGMGFAFFDRGRPKEISFSYIVTTGNEVRLEVFDVVDYLIDEGHTNVFLLFLENIKTATTFRRVADKALRAGKPIIVTKIGHSEAGQRAAASHTAALAGNYDAYQAMFRHYGIVEGHDIEEMVDFAAAFSCYREKLPAGFNVGIGTASGGGGGWMADACAAEGLRIPTLDDATRKLIDAHLPAYGTSQNPVDGTAQAIREIGYSELARLIALSDRVDAVIMVTSARSAEIFKRDRHRLESLARECPKPVLFWSYTSPCDESTRILNEAGFHLFTNLRHCARAAAMLANYRVHRERFLLAAPKIELDVQRAAHVRTALEASALCEYQVYPLLNSYGIQTIGAELAASAHDAVRIAAMMHAPVALKVQSTSIPHKTDARAVALELRDASSIQEAYDRLIRNATQYAPHAKIDGVLVQRMAAPGLEVIVAIRRDELFGPMLMIGLGGVHVEVLRDVVLSPVPVSHEAARELLARLRGCALLNGVRGGNPVDKSALVDLIVRLSQFAIEHGEHFDVLELNPVLVHDAGEGVSIVDALLTTRQ